MSTIINFPAEAAARRLDMNVGVGAPREGSAIILILPVVRIERDPDGTNDTGPEEGTAPGRRRRRRVRS